MSKFVDELKKDIEGMEARHEQHKELRHEKHEENKFARELKHQMKHEEHEKVKQGRKVAHEEKKRRKTRKTWRKEIRKRVKTSDEAWRIKEKRWLYKIVEPSFSLHKIIY